jgi:DNA-binding GntR family transcriptional regulator
MATEVAGAVPSEVTRETARKAVRVLVAEGLVYVEQGRGACVAWRG